MARIENENGRKHLVREIGQEQDRRDPEQVRMRPKQLESREGIGLPPQERRPLVLRQGFRKDEGTVQDIGEA